MTEVEWLSVFTLTMSGMFAGHVVGQRLPHRPISGGSCLMVAVLAGQSILSLQSSLPPDWMVRARISALVLALVALAWIIVGDRPRPKTG
jgi:hypothetical protein